MTYSGLFRELEFDAYAYSAAPHTWMYYHWLQRDHTFQTRSTIHHFVSLNSSALRGEITTYNIWGFSQTCPIAIFQAPQDPLVQAFEIVSAHTAIFHLGDELNVGDWLKKDVRLYLIQETEIEVIERSGEQLFFWQRLLLLTHAFNSDSVPNPSRLSSTARSRCLLLLCLPTNWRAVHNQEHFQGRMKMEMRKLHRLRE